MDEQETRPWILARTGPALLLLVALSFGYNWYYLTAGFQADEFIFLAMLRQDPLPFSRAMGFWSRDDLPVFQNMWWLEEGAGGGFWRPLPSLVLEGSVKIFGENAFPLHLLSLLLHGLVAFSLFLIVRRITSQHVLALLAAVFFISCEDHSMGVGWISTITDLICVLFINLSILCHVDWLHKRCPWAYAGSLLLLVPALASKETAVIAPVALVVLSAVMTHGGSLKTRVARFLRDWPSWAPQCSVLALYLGLYKGLDLGGMHNLMYIDPMVRPLEFLSHLVLHMPLMWLATLGPMSPSVSMFMPSAVTPLAAVGAACFASWLAALWPLRRDPLVLWSMLLYLGALLPQMGSDASERGMYLPSVMASILLALLAVRVGPIARRLLPDEARPPWWTRAFGWIALLVVLAPGVVLSAVYPFSFLPSMSKPEAHALTALEHVEASEAEHLLLLNTAGSFDTFYVGAVLDHHLDRPLDVRLLSSCDAVVSVELTGEASFEIHVDRPGWTGNMFARVVRVDPAMQQGRMYDGGVFTATLLELTPDGTDVLSVRFDVDRPLDDPSLLLLFWDGGSFRPLDLSSLSPGERMELADTSDLFANW